ncbi:MAG TPA: substrate-binding domain-containing protein, partial [bacterium]
DAMKANDLKADPKLVAECAAFAEEEGLRATRSLLKGHTPFTAIVAANDRLALGAYDALAERGLRCPDDISITGFNDMPLVDKVRPPLTTVRIPLYDMGAQAAQMLLSQLGPSRGAPRTLALEPTLVVRGSTGQAKAL